MESNFQSINPRWIDVIGHKPKFIKIKKSLLHNKGAFSKKKIFALPNSRVMVRSPNKTFNQIRNYARSLHLESRIEWIEHYIQLNISISKYKYNIVIFYCYMDLLYHVFGILIDSFY